jgi:hypothetical protein
MKRLSIAVLGFLLAAGCSSSTAPSTNTSGATTTRFIATLSPAQETPAVTNAESSGSGTATIDITISRDPSGVALAATVNFSVTLAGLPSSAVVNIAHIHTGVAGVSGGVLVNTSLAPGQVTLTGGAGSFTRNDITTLSTSDAQAIVNNPAGFYFNVHTALNPAGVMRGQLVKQ